MNKSITISFPDELPDPIELSYSISTLERIQTIACSINGLCPQWLQVKKFQLSSMIEKNGYTPLFNESNNSKNMATSLFIDKVYTDIMLTEKYKILIPAF